MTTTLQTAYTEYAQSLTELLTEAQTLLTSAQYATLEQMTMLHLQATVSEDAESLNDQASELRYELEETLSSELLASESVSYLMSLA